MVGQWQEVNAPAASLGLDRGLIDKHDWNVVFDEVDPVAVGALQVLRVLAIFQSLLARRANQQLQ